MTYRGRVKNGIVELEPGANLPDGTVVNVEPAQTQATEGELSELFQIERYAVSTGMPDLATNLDHYLYGSPKVRDVR